jgi:UDP-galactopyranose mutase
MFAFRDSTPTFFQHHLIIEGQRKGREGLIAGIKKDVVISDKLTREAKKNRVAIYGWHKLDGKPIQPLYTGHVDWYVDYSHGIRLIYRTIWIDGKHMDYIDVMKHPVYKRLLCDEDACDVYRY